MEEAGLHLLPCKAVAEDVPRVECETNAYFYASMREEGSDERGQPTFSASFRGRPLRGVELSLPQSYTGGSIINCALFAASCPFIRAQVSC